MAVTFALQSLMKWACDRLTGFWRIAAADIFLFFSFVGTVNVWRGVWQLIDIYFLPGKINDFDVVKCDEVNKTSLMDQI